MADKGINSPIAPLGDFTLYVQKYSAGDYESFPVQKVDLLPNSIFSSSFRRISESLIYPDCAKNTGPELLYIRFLSRSSFPQLSDKWMHSPRNRERPIPK